MERKEFRKHAHAVVDWMADYLENVEQLDVYSDPAPKTVSNALPAAPPAHGEPFEELMRDFRQHIVPNMTHWNHPRFFAYFPANNSPPSILAEMLTAALGAQCMSWQTSPAATELEARVMEWLRDLLALPKEMTGVIQDTASTATLTALICARERATQWAYAQTGGAALKDRPLTVYASTQAHSSVDKGVKLAGYGLKNLRRIQVDAHYAMDPEALATAIERDRKRGYRPAVVVATVGTTGTTAIDPLEPIGAVCRRHGIWLHVDGALAGTAAMLEEKRHLFSGLEAADSFVFNPHKWMFTNFDCSAYFVRDVDALRRTMSTDPEYLKTRHDGVVHNYRDWSIPLGRRFRALKLWFVMRSYGTQGLRSMVRRHLALAAAHGARIDRDADWELLAPVPLNLVCFRFHPQDKALDEQALNRLNARLLQKINQSGFCMLTHTKLDGRFTLRWSIGQTYTQKRHVEEAWQRVQQTAHTLCSELA
jgi:aromatic-L-amino-acid decarboxylase